MGENAWTKWDEKMWNCWLAGLQGDVFADIAGWIIWYVLWIWSVAATVYISGLRLLLRAEMRLLEWTLRCRED